MADDAWRTEDPRLALALNHSMSVMAFQREHLGEMRNRSTAFLSVASLGLGLVHDAVLPAKHLRPVGIVTLLALAVLFACTLFVMLPRRWTFTFDVAHYDWHFKRQSTIDEMLRTLFDQGVKRITLNFERLRRIEKAYTAAAWALVSVVALLIIATATR